MLRNVNVPKGEIFLPLPGRPPAAPPNPEQILDNILMDFIKGLPHSKGADTILVVVDHLSKYAYFVPLHRPFSAQEANASRLRLSRYRVFAIHNQQSGQDLCQPLFRVPFQTSRYPIEVKQGISPPDQWTDRGSEPLTQTLFEVLWGRMAVQLLNFHSMGRVLV